MDYYLAVKKYKIITFMDKWKKVETIILSDTESDKKGKYYIFLSFVDVILNFQIHVIHLKYSQRSENQ